MNNLGPATKQALFSISGCSVTAALDYAALQTAKLGSL